MHKVLVNRLEGLSLPRKSVVRLTDRPDMTLDVYRGRKTTMQQQQQQCNFLLYINEIVLDIGSNIRLFADDTCLFIIVDNRVAAAD